MKKIISVVCLACMLGGCVGMVEGRSKTAGKKTLDMYVLHPVVTISGYISQM